ncbi:hypothetical protein Tco_0889986 [Tanacetum coccineum]
MSMWIISRGAVLLILLGLRLRCNQQFSWDIIVLFQDKVSEVKREMLRLDFKICAKDKNFSSIWTYTTMMLLRVRNHHGAKFAIRNHDSFDVDNPFDSIFICMDLLVLVRNMLLDSFPYLDYSKLVHLYLCFNLARAIWSVWMHPRIHNIHQRSTSSFHLAEEDLRLGNLKFVPKGEEDEVFGMPIPNELISNNIKNAPYYNAYLEMVAKHDQKVAAKKEGKKKSASTNQPKPKHAIEKSSKPAPTPKPKVTKEKPSKASTAKPPKLKLAKENSIQLVDEPDEEQTHSEPEPEPEQEGAGEEYDMERAIQMSLESFQAQSQACWQCGYS